MNMDKENLIWLIIVVSVIIFISLIVKIYNKLTEKKRKEKAGKELMKILNNPFDTSKGWEKFDLERDNKKKSSIKNKKGK
jgi:hypothetical protein